jgi:multisubunit Na+/H+ antiporter MnhB subunit
MIAGPGGALAGGIIGASVITVHLLVDHPQATLDDGTVLLFTLSEPLHLVPAAQTGN